MPAISAKFTADVSDFRAKLQTLVTEVTGFDRTQKQVAAEVKKFANDFSGANMIRQLDSMAKAVEDLGGTSRLTASEVNRLAGTTTEVLAKYQALGQEAPADIQRIANEAIKLKAANEAAAKSASEVGKATKAAGDSSSPLSGIFNKLGPSITGAFSVGAVVSFGKSLVDMASQIHDVAEQTGLSTNAVQELKYAATQTGTSLEVVTGAIDKMSKNLAEGTSKTRAAVKELGLSFDALRQESPEQAFNELATAIQAVPDPMKQTQIAMELFGKSGAKILPAIKEGISDLSKEAHDLGQVLDEESIKSLEAFGDKWDQLMTGLKVSAATAALNIGDSFKNIPTFLELLSNIKNFGAGGVGLSLGVNTALNRAAANVRTADIALPKATAVAPTGLVEQLTAARNAIAQFTPEMRAAAAAGEALHLSDEKIAEGVSRVKGGFEVTAGVIKVYGEQLKEVTKLSPEKALTEAAQKALALATFIQKAGGVAAFSAQQQEAFNKTLRDGADAYEALHRTGSQNYTLILDLAGATQNWKKGLGDSKLGIDGIIGSLAKLDLHKDWLDFLIGGDTPKGIQINNNGIGDLGTKLQNPMQVINDKLKEAQLHTIDWSRDLDSLAGVMQQVGQTGNSSFDRLIGQLGLMIQLGGQAGRSIGGLVIGSDLNGNAVFNPLQAFKAPDGTYNAGSISAGSFDYLQAGLQAYGTLNNATNIQGRGSRALAGAEAGAAIGAYPALATATYGISIGVGAAVGALIGALRNPGFEQEMKRVATTFGTFITEDMGKALDALAENQFHGDRQAAEEYSFGDILQQAGGLKSSNVDTYTKRLRDVFSELDTGKFTVQQTQDVLEKNFSTFADYVTKSKDLASKAFQDIITLNHAMGVDAESVRQFVGQQAQSLGSDLAALAGPLVQQYGGITDKIKTIKEQLGDLSAKPDLGVEDSADQAALTKELNELLAKQAEGAATAGEEMARLGVIALASFNAAVAGGEDVVSALADIGPGLDQLIGLQKDLGIETDNAAVSQLEHFRDLVNQNETLVLSASALGDGLKALTSIGGLTTEALAAMEQQGGQTFDRLVAAGFTENEALQQMKGFLLNVLQAHKQLGTPIDENTQRLLDMAEAQGLLEDDNPTEILKQGFKDVTRAINDLVHALGYDVPNAAALAGQEIRDRLPSHVPVDVDFHYNLPDLPDIDMRGRQAPPTATGGIVWTPQTRLVGEAGPEVISPLSQLPSLLGPRRNEGAIYLQPVTLTMDGSVVTRTVLKLTQRELRNYGAAR